MAGGSRTSGCVLYGENTVIVTVMNNGSDVLSHVGKDGKLEIAQYVDGFLTGVHVYSPDFAEDEAKPFTQKKLDAIADKNGTESELRFTVKTMNVLSFQRQQLKVVRSMADSYDKMLDYLDVQLHEMD